MREEEGNIARLKHLLSEGARQQCLPRSPSVNSFARRRVGEGMTHTPADVSAVVCAEIQALFGAEQIGEPTTAIVLENFRARFNRALKIASNSPCLLPPDHPVRKLRA